jgi:hypothetical protein
MMGYCAIAQSLKVSIGTSLKIRLYAPRGMSQSVRHAPSEEKEKSGQ